MINPFEEEVIYFIINRFYIELFPRWNQWFIRGRLAIWARFKIYSKFERDNKKLLSFSWSTQNEVEISEQAIIDEFFSKSNSEEEKVTIPYSLNIREEESNINISPLNDKSCSTEKIIKKKFKRK